LTNLVSRRF